jgi:hypothetical protein
MFENRGFRRIFGPKRDEVYLWQTTQVMGWLQLVNDAFYVIASGVFQCMEEYH